MASETVVSEGGEKEGVGVKQRHVEIKVYTRKAFRKPRKEIVNDKKDVNNINKTVTVTETNGGSATVATTGSFNFFASATAANNDKNESKKNREANRVNDEGGHTSIDTIIASGYDNQKVKENGSKESVINGINGISDRIDDGGNHQENDRNVETTTPSTAVIATTHDTSASGDDSHGIVEQRDNSLVQVVETDSRQTGDLEKGYLVQEESTIPDTTIVSTVDITASVVESMGTDNQLGNQVVELDSQQTGTLEKASSVQEEPATTSATMITADVDAVTRGDVGNNFDKQRGNDLIQVAELDSLRIDTLEKECPGQEGAASRLNANSNDSSGLHRQQIMTEEFPSASGAALIADGSGLVQQGVQSGVKMNLASKSKQERRELRRKLEDELLLVRGLVKKIEAKEGQLVSVFNNSRAPVNYVVDNELRRVNSDVGSVGIPRESVIHTPTPTPRQSRPFNQLSVSLLENGRSGNEHVEKEKRTPKENQFYSHSEFFLAKDKFRPTESNKKSKSNSKKQGGVEMGWFGTGTKIFKNCSALLEKLMKHKHGWVFNNPVDVKGLGLHDYFTIIKHPMDLGTIKSRLNKNWYKTPEEFAEDVRLTFHNAMRYNPKGQDVHIMAEMLLTIFEEKWAVIKLEYDREMRFAASYDMGIPTPTSRKAPLPFRPPPLDMRRIWDRSESRTYAPVNPPVSARPKPITTTPSSRTPAPKKPKAKDPNKRDMTYDEKQKLSANLQNLPSEKLDNIVQIVKKRNSALFHHDDEIEVDIDSVDTETLWELDRFVTNYKKNLSKHKRKAELALQGRVEKEQKIQEQTTVEVLNEAPLHTTTADERNITSAPPVQLDKQGDNGSRSSSSSSSSSDSGSSSTDSNSDSSSDSES